MEESGPILVELADPRTRTLGSELANETGRKVLMSLSAGPKNPSAIASEIGAPITTVLFHIQKLEEAGLHEG